MRLVIDRDLMNDEYISGHPGISTSTIRLKKEELLKYVQAVGHELPTSTCLIPALWRSKKIGTLRGKV